MCLRFLVVFDFDHRMQAMLSLNSLMGCESKLCWRFKSFYDVGYELNITDAFAGRVYLGFGRAACGDLLAF